MSSTQSVYARMFEKESTALLELARSIKPGKQCKQLQEGKSHPLWLIGHIINTNNFLINMSCCGGSNKLPKGWGPKFAPDFGGGVAPTADADFYPSWDELLEALEEVSKACGEGINNLSDEEISGELGEQFPDALRGFFKTVENTLETVIMHSAYHRGQIALINLQD